MDNLEICKQTRKFAAESLYIVLKELLASTQPVSEVMLRDAWLQEMRKNKNIFPDGWYTPPPHGMIVLFSKDNDYKRINYLSARPADKWPRNDIFLDKQKGLIYVYASPVDKESGIIGDFGLTLYFGKDKEIIEIVKHYLQADKKIYEKSNVGMTLGEIAEISRQTLKQYNMQNESLAVTDKGDNVLGHTIPEGFTAWNEHEADVLKNNNWDEIKDIISQKRINVKDNENYIIQRNSAITIEPRPKILNRLDLPQSLSYHTIAIFKENGEKELLTNFDKLFTLTGMEYMISL